MEEMSGKDLCRIRQRLVDGQAEINGINKILDYCSNWADRLELEMDRHKTNKIKNVICAPGSFRGYDVIGEEFAIINEMVRFCHKRIDELKDEFNDIRGQLSRYNHGDYDITCKYYEWFFHTSCLASDEALPQPTINVELCKVCELRNCPHYPLHSIGSERR